MGAGASTAIVHYRHLMQSWHEHLGTAKTLATRQCDFDLAEQTKQAWEALSDDDKLLAERVVDAEMFRPGLWTHYKGGMYTATRLVTHHELRLPMVAYVSHTYGGEDVRPLRPHPYDRDGWNDIIDIGEMLVPRFFRIGSLPSDVRIKDR
jgi:hypothetical protein